MLAEKTNSGRNALEQVFLPLLESLTQPALGSPLGEINLEAVLQYMLFLLSFSANDIIEKCVLGILKEVIVDVDNQNNRALFRAINSYQIEQMGSLTLLKQIINEFLVNKIKDAVALRQFLKFQNSLDSVEINNCNSENQPEDNNKFEEFKNQIKERKSQIEKLSQENNDLKIKTKEKIKRKLKNKNKKKLSSDSFETLDSFKSFEISEDENSDCGVGNGRSSIASYASSLYSQ